MPRLTNLVGKRFGRLTVVAYVESRRLYKSGELHRIWLCSCDCGGNIEVNTYYLTDGRTWHCSECNPPRRDDYTKNYRDYRARFTQTQRLHYEQIMRTRRGRSAEAEAVAIVMKEQDVA